MFAQEAICMAENKEYFSKEVENGSIQISEEVVASVAAVCAAFRTQSSVSPPEA